MAMLTVRNLPDEVHRALRVRAAQHGHSTEAEVREILAVAVKPESRVRLGDCPRGSWAARRRPVERGISRSSSKWETRRLLSRW